MNKLSLDTILERIDKMCVEKNYEFLGFCDKDGNECEYKRATTTYLKLHCNICGNEWNSTTYDNFVHGHGCSKCVGQGLSLEEHIEIVKNECKKRNYDFLGFCDKDGKDCEWYGCYTYLKLHCNICGNNWNTTSYNNFMRGNGCSNCKGGKKLNINEVLWNIKKVCLQKKYIFLEFCDKEGNKDEYKNARSHLKLHCNTCGNTWTSTTYDNLIHNHGCPQCQSSKLEEEIRFFLKEEEVEEQKKFKWLGRQKLDFYLPKYNCAIECQGVQHFKRDHFYKELEVIQERDKRKKQLCDEHGVRLLYYSNLEIDYPYQVYEDKDELLKAILT